MPLFHGKQLKRIACRLSLAAAILFILIAAGCSEETESTAAPAPDAPAPAGSGATPKSALVTIACILSERPDKPASVSVAENPPAAPDSSGTEAPGEATPAPPAAASYILDIMGRSNKLSAAAWRRMEEWRSQMREYAEKNDSIWLNGPDRKAVALTFDDGPDEATTAEVLRILKEKGVTASFFFVGNKIKRHEALVKQAYEEGHLIFSHSYSHSELTKLSPDALKQELEQTDQAIEAIIGKRPALLRPPYGETNAAVEQAWMDSPERKLVLWSLDTLDWSLKEKEPIIANVDEFVRNGDIILMHSTGSTAETAAALPVIIDILLERGFSMVGLDELLETPAYVDDKNE